MEKIAKMAMLDIADAERLWSDVEKMLAMAENLEEAEVTNAERVGTGELRADEACREHGVGGYIIVPKVVIE